MKVVISDWGWGLSKKAYKRIAELMGVECHFYEYDYEYSRKYLEVSYDDIENIHERSRLMYASPAPNAETFTELMNQYDNLPVREANILYKKSLLLPGFSGMDDCKERSNPILVQVAEELGQELMDCDHHHPRIVEIPDDIDWYIDSDEGCEWVAEKHRMWR